jgi:hypothetical protein
MKRPATLIATLTISAVAHGQAFTNLDFEAASTAGSIPPFGFLPWSSAAPGWAGSDTSPVFYGTTHVGTPQWFLLVDAATQPGGALSGNYSMRFASGYESVSPGAPWVNAFLSQSGIVPANTQSLRLLASGPLEIRVNGNVTPLVPLGAQSFGVDMSAYAGSLAEIRFINPSMQHFESVTIDGIAFSPVAVPEVAPWMLLGLGLSAVFGVTRSRLLAATTRAASDA